MSRNTLRWKAIATLLLKWPLFRCRHLIWSVHKVIINDVPLNVLLDCDILVLRRVDMSKAAALSVLKSTLYALIPRLVVRYTCLFFDSLLLI